MLFWTKQLILSSFVQFYREMFTSGFPSIDVVAFRDKELDIFYLYGMVPC